MPLTFQYEAIDTAGKRVTGTITATSEKEVVQAIGDRGLLPVRIDQAREGGTGLSFLQGKKPPTGLVMARVYSSFRICCGRGWRCFERSKSSSDSPSLGCCRRRWRTSARASPTARIGRQYGEASARLQ